MLRARRALENHQAGFGGNGHKVQQHGDRRLWQLAADNAPEKLHAGALTQLFSGHHASRSKSLADCGLFLAPALQGVFSIHGMSLSM
jgi:hypothetical protein